MERNFAAVMSELRHARGLSQRKVAADLKISQALLSHYENGAREPGLAFVCRACPNTSPLPCTTVALQAKLQRVEK